jgi:hypothetical protein
LRTNLLIIPAVKAAVEGFQSADKPSWNRLFASKAELYDNGSPRDMRCFTQEALGCQRFLSIDRVANNGLYVEGEFYSEKAGSYRAYFNFELNNAARIRRLDIGMVEDAG